MALFIKFRTREVSENMILRFESSVRLFTIFGKKLGFTEPEFFIFNYEPIEELNVGMKKEKFDFGSFNVMLNQLKKKKNNEILNSGLVITSHIQKNNKKFECNLILNPWSISKRYYDIRIDIVPNKFASKIDNLEKIVPNLRDILRDRIIEYNKENEKQYYIKHAVLSDHGEEISGISKWKMFYSDSPEAFIQLILNSTNKLQKGLDIADEKKLANDLMSNENFWLSLGQEAEKNKVEISSGSIYIKPESTESMTKFINVISKELESFVTTSFPTREQIRRKIDKFYSA